MDMRFRGEFCWWEVGGLRMGWCVGWICNRFVVVGIDDGRYEHRMVGFIDIYDGLGACGCALRNPVAQVLKGLYDLMQPLQQIDTSTDRLCIPPFQ